MSNSTRARTGRGAKGLVAALLLAGAAALGGCATSPSNAAVVDGSTISRQTLSASITGAQQVSQLTGDQVLSVLIQAQIAERVAADEGLTITDADREEQLNPQVLAVADARDFALELADVQIVAGEVGEQQFTEALRGADVEVNPRYGSWDPEQVAVNPEGGMLAQSGGGQQP